MYSDVFLKPRFKKWATVLLMTEYVAVQKQLIAKNTPRRQNVHAHKQVVELYILRHTLRVVECNFVSRDFIVFLGRLPKVDLII